MADLTLEFIRDRLGGEIISDAVTAPFPGRGDDDRSLLIRLDPGCHYGLFMTSLAEDPFPRVLDHVLTSLGIEKMARTTDHMKGAADEGEDDEDDEPGLDFEKPVVNPKKRKKAKELTMSAKPKKAKASKAADAGSADGTGRSRVTPCLVEAGPERDRKGLLIADPATVKLFFNLIFRYADPNSYITLRVFEDKKGAGPPYYWRGFKVGQAKLLEKICDLIGLAANRPTPHVFCPPLATFDNAKRARLEDLQQGLVLSVECDSDAEAAVAKLSAILGPATCVVASGGTWIDANGEVRDRLHGHWRLRKPTDTADEHCTLHQLRKLATAIVGGDSSNNPPVHPLRWPGSWHLKKVPRRARLVTVDPDAELDIADAWAKLAAAYPELAAEIEGGHSGAAGNGHDADGASDDHLADLDDIIAALAVIPNDNVEWNDWKKVMMAVYRATAGQGFGAFRTWSQKSNKHDDANTLAEWRRLEGCPPTRIGAGSLFHWAAEAEPGWVKPSWAARAANMPPDDDDDEPESTESAGTAQTTESSDTTDSSAISKTAGAKTSPAASTKKTAGRRRIELIAGRLARAADEVIAALVVAKVPLYIRGHMLVKPFSCPAKTHDGLETHVPAMAQVAAATLLDHISRHVNLVRYNARANKWVPCNAPVQLADIILSRKGGLPFEQLSGLLATPSLRPDGSNLSTVGYDAMTRMVLLNPPPMPAMPPEPSRKDAVAALAILDDLLVEFPFVDEASRSVALSGFLTVVARACMAVAPAHAISAPEPGTGKSYLMDLISLVGNGAYMPASTMPDDKPDQLDKLIDAAMIAGNPLLCLDNVNGEIGGDKLCVAIERPVADVRILGTSTLVRCENRMTVFINGNNMVLRGDVTRRVVTANLDAGIPQPETRTFKHRPHLKITADRGKLIAASLTIVRAYILAGRPGRLPPLASFEQWSDNVRSALVWLGCADPVDTVRAAQESDPADLQRSALFQALYEIFKNGDKPTTVEFTTAEIIEKAKERSALNADPYSGPELENPELAEAIDAVAGWRGEINRRRLGKWLAANTRRFAIGAKLKLIISPVRAHGGGPKWQIVPA